MCSTCVFYLSPSASWSLTHSLGQWGRGEPRTQRQDTGATFLLQPGTIFKCSLHSTTTTTPLRQPFVLFATEEESTDGMTFQSISPLAHLTLGQDNNRANETVVQEASFHLELGLLGWAAQNRNSEKGIAGCGQ